MHLPGHLPPQICTDSHMLIFAQSFTERLTYVVLSLLGRSQMDLMFTLCFWLAVVSTCQYGLK